MIKDEKIGLEISESDEETDLSRVIEDCEKAISDVEKMGWFQTLVLNAAKKRLKEIDKSKEAKRKD